MKKKIVLSIILIVIVVTLVYLKVTTISFENNRGHISSIYCSLLSKEQPNDPVIFVPGIKGSMLNNDNKRVWITLSQALHNTDPFIYDENQTNITPTGIFSRIVIIPYLYEYRSYYLTVNQLACSQNAYFYAYDWRANPINSAEGLGNLVERVTHETGKKPSIIAHSMGGLLTRYIAINKPESINKAIYVGTPFQPGTGFFDDIVNGAEIGLNKTIINNIANQSHYSSFVLLPHTGNNQYNALDLLSIKSWENTLFKQFNIKEQQQNKIRLYIEVANSFNKIIDSEKIQTGKDLYIYSDCKETPSSVEQNKLFHAPGDTRVVAKGAVPLDYSPSKDQTFIYCTTHDQQLNNTRTYKKMIEFLNQ